MKINNKHLCLELFRIHIIYFQLVSHSHPQSLKNKRRFLIPFSSFIKNVTRTQIKTLGMHIWGYMET